MSSSSVTDTLTFAAYRLAAYWVNSVVDDPALLAFIFC